MQPFIPKYCQIVLVGLKTEIENKKISDFEAMNFARKHKMHFYPVSSKTGENVQLMFQDIVEYILTDFKKNRIQLPERLGGMTLYIDKKRRYSCWPW